MKISVVSTIFLLIVLVSGIMIATYPHSNNYAKQVPVGLRIVSAVLSAVVDLKPDALNLRSKGKWITAYTELPEGYNIVHIDVSSIMLNDTIPAESRPTTIGDYDEDGIPDLMVKFERAEVISYILDNVEMEERFMTITLTVTGYLNDDTSFQGSDTIRIIMP